MGQKEVLYVMVRISDKMYIEMAERPERTGITTAVDLQSVGAYIMASKSKEDLVKGSYKPLHTNSSSQHEGVQSFVMFKVERWRVCPRTTAVACVDIRRCPAGST